VTVAHIAGIPIEEWLMPFMISAGAVLVGLRTMFQRGDRRVDRPRSKHER
jgi:hypothetical protein